MAQHDPVAQGRVQLLSCPSGDAAQAMAAIDEMVRLSKLDPDFSWSRTAIIAREWRRLEPVRAYADTLEIPVELANETPLAVWRLREMQAFVSGLRTDPGRLVSIPDMLALLNTQPTNRWIDLIAEGIAALAREIGTGLMPALDAIEWLAEWARDTRRDQRSLLLMTGHRAKGLEFDHVVLLNGGWGAVSRDKGEDEDAPRRLFYVGMTRARKTLAVMAAGEHRFLKTGSDAVLEREVRVDEEKVPPSRKHYELPNPKTVDLSYAGRLGSNHVAHEAIASARVGDDLKLVREGIFWVLRDHRDRPLGRMARSWQPPAGLTFLRGSVGAVVRWRKADNEESYRDRVKREEWEAVLPELEFVGHRGGRMER